MHPRPALDAVLAGAVVDRMAEAVLIADDEARFLHANPAAVDLTGIPADKLLTLSVFDITPPEARDAGRKAWAEFLANGSLEGPYTIQRPDGSVRDTLFSAYAHVQPNRHLSLMADITDLQAGTRALSAARRQLAQAEKLSALGTLTSGVAHEVRTPLTFIANNLFLIHSRLERAVGEGKAPRELLEGLEEPFRDATAGVDRINQLVLELRHFGRQQPGERRPARLDAVVADAVKLFSTTTRTHDVEQKFEPVGPLPIDASQVQQVVLNLLDNAAEATGPGGTIRVEVRRNEEGGIVVVEDDGPGITADVKDHMFETFYTTKPEGTGLGLGIVKRLVHAHGGEVSWENLPEGGTRFSFTIPLE